MSRTLKHRIEGLFHHGLIPLSEVPRSVMNGWDRKNAMSFAHKTGGHQKAEKLSRIRQEEEISDLQETNFKIY